MHERQTKIDKVFKAKNPKRYIQVKTQLINDGSQIIAICSDISRIKEAEAQGQKVRATFFSSVAHELRTPLNSIIPILQLILGTYGLGNASDRIQNLLKIVLNSGIHLSNVIEDALDISRLENNNFTLFKETFNIRKVIDEVCEIMKF